MPLPDTPAPSAVGTEQLRRTRPRLSPAVRPPACPNCGSDRLQGHGSFKWKDGTRRQRIYCRACRTTFNPHTGTPLHYLKKREEWARQGPGLGQGLSVRAMARSLGVRIPTAFGWRHRLLTALSAHPQPLLSGQVAISEAYVSYSEKGSRTSSGPGAWGVRRGRGLSAANRKAKAKSPFRRFVDGKPSCVLLVYGGARRTAVTVGQGRPGQDVLESCLKRLFLKGTELWSSGLLSFTEVSRRLRLRCREPKVAATLPGAGRVLSGVEGLRRQLYGWLSQFFGVATRYLDNYLTWCRLVRLTAPRSSAEAGLRMLAAALVRGRSGPAG